MKLLDTARLAWPSFVFDDDFERFLVTRGEPTRLSVEDLALAWACLTKQPGAITAFTQFVRPSVDVALARVPKAEREDLEQALWLKLFTGTPAGLASYSGLGSLKGWVRISLSRLAINAATRGRDAVADEGELLDLLSPREDPELMALKLELKGQFQGALEAAFLSLSSRERQLLRQVIGHGATVDEVARALELPRSTAGRHLKDARERFAQALQQQVASQFGSASVSARRLLELVESQLDQGWWRLTGMDRPRD